MSTITASLQGRFGNQCMTYLFCRALAERTDSGLLVDPWLGEQVFQLPSQWNRKKESRRVNAIDALQWSMLPDDKRDDIEVRDYCQYQSAMIYRKREAQSWLKIRPEVAMMCGAIVNTLNGGLGDCPIICHRRVGDYKGYSYPICSADSYQRALAEYGLDASLAAFVTEENPTPHSPLPDDISFVVDFYRMVNAKALLRGNSSFSWVAALLGNGLVLSPVIDGLEGGKEHTVRFVAGNWPRLANFDFTTDLHITP